ncbi:CBS domain-containing protein [Gemmatimonas sp.]
MNVSELMRTDVRTIRADANVAEAVQIMADSHVSGLPVVDRSDRVVGVLSTTDVLQAQAEHDDRRARTELFERTEVRELMSTPPQTIGPNADVRDAAKHMLEAEVHRLFVVDGDRLVGVISQTDIARAVGAGEI